MHLSQTKLIFPSLFKPLAKLMALDKSSSTIKKPEIEILSILSDTLMAKVTTTFLQVTPTTRLENTA